MGRLTTPLTKRISVFLGVNVTFCSTPYYRRFGTREWRKAQARVCSSVSPPGSPQCRHSSLWETVIRRSGTMLDFSSGVSGSTLRGSWLAAKDAALNITFSLSQVFHDRSENGRSVGRNHRGL